MKDVRVAPVAPGGDPDEWLYQVPTLEHASVTVRPPVRVIDAHTGAVVMIAVRPEPPPGVLRRALGKIPYNFAGRSSGMKTRSRIFGYRPRVVTRHDFCAAAGLAVDNPQEHRVFLRWGGYMAHLMRKHCPEQYDAQVQLLDAEVLPEWRLPGQPFTGGIANKNTELVYHRDTGNFPGSWSSLLVVSQGTTGGELVLPHYGVALDPSGYCAALADFQLHPHGVAPIHRPYPAAARWSLVYYAQQGMRLCLPPKEELTRARSLKSEREQRQHSARREELIKVTKPTHKTTIKRRRKKKGA